MWTVILLLVGSYLLGSLNFALVFSRLLKKPDVRIVDHAGASGAFRQYGPTIGILTLVLDGLKGALVGWLCILLLPQLNSWVMLAAGMAVVAGHDWPIFFHFYGGGGLTTVFGFLIVVLPVHTAIFFAFTMLLTLIFWLTPLGRLMRPLGRPLPAASIIGMLAYVIYGFIVLPVLWYALLLLVLGLLMVAARVRAMMAHPRKGSAR